MCGNFFSSEKARHVNKITFICKKETKKLDNVNDDFYFETFKKKPVHQIIYKQLVVSFYISQEFNCYNRLGIKHV